jgi:hypothetical protein
VAWFERKIRNRRFQRKHVLQVKLRSSERRKLRLRRAVMAICVPGFVLLGAYGVWQGGDWLLRRFVYENSAFAIHQIDVQTDGILSLEQIRRWAGVKLQDNLLALDLSRVQRDLEAIPTIQSAGIERVLPHTLKIRVVEREPVAQILLPNPNATNLWEKSVFLVGADGTIMLPLEPHQRTQPNPGPDALPNLLGIPGADLRPGRRVESAQALAALKLISVFEGSAMAGRVDIRHIDVGIPNLLQISTAQSSEITFGLHDLEGQLRRWKAVHDYGQKNGKYVAWIDLSVANNVPARWLEAGIPAPPKPKASKIYRTKKRHV